MCGGIHSIGWSVLHNSHSPFLPPSVRAWVCVSKILKINLLHQPTLYTLYVLMWVSVPFYYYHMIFLMNSLRYLTKINETKQNKTKKFIYFCNTDEKKSIWQQTTWAGPLISTQFQIMLRKYCHSFSIRTRHTEFITGFRILFIFLNKFCMCALCVCFCLRIVRFQCVTTLKFMIT